jgi:hypothetical protein
MPIAASPAARGESSRDTESHAAGRLGGAPATHPAAAGRVFLHAPEGNGGRARGMGWCVFVLHGSTATSWRPAPARGRAPHAPRMLQGARSHGGRARAGVRPARRATQKAAVRRARHAAGVRAQSQSVAGAGETEVVSCSRGRHREAGGTRLGRAPLAQMGGGAPLSGADTSYKRRALARLGAPGLGRRPRRRASRALGGDSGGARGQHRRRRRARRQAGALTCGAGARASPRWPRAPRRAPAGAPRPVSARALTGTLRRRRGAPQRQQAWSGRMWTAR